MKIINDSLSLPTRGDGDMLDITERLELLRAKHDVRNGHMLVFISGSTAGITTIEYEPGLKKDFDELMERLAPQERHYHHEETWNDGNGHSHIRASVIGPSITIPIGDGRLLLGTWQQVILIDFDNRPRSRNLVVQLTTE